VINDGASLGAQSLSLLVLLLWGSLCFAIAVRFFRWT
jgi:hypothetical protein